MAVLSGFLFYAGFAPWEMWIAPYVAIVLLFRILCDQALPERFTYSLLSGLAFFLPLLHWSSVYVGSVPWLVLAVGESLFFAAICLVRWQRRWESALIFPVIFTAIELLRMKFPFGGFGWGRLGFTQVDSLNWLYPLIGVTGISLLVSASAFLLISQSKTIFAALSILAATFLLSNILSPDAQGKVLQVTA
ncbi:MAG: hypothetical protein ACKOFL_02415, partial [Actinomycetota bacterium]